MFSSTIKRLIKTLEHVIFWGNHWIGCRSSLLQMEKIYFLKTDQAGELPIILKEE
jgi:hypothetical protein